MTESSPRQIWITWERHRRTRELCGALGPTLFELTSPARRPFRYAALLVRTIVRLAAERPDVLFIQCPSVLLGLYAAVLKPVFRYRLVADLHNEAVQPSNYSFWFYNIALRIIHRSADLNIVTNESLKRVVERAGARAFVLPDRVPTIPFGAASPVDPSSTRVVFICSYGADEPYREMLDAVRLLEPGWTVSVTGNSRRLDVALRRSAAHNVRFTGFLPESEYEQLLRDADVVVDLTTRENCLVCGAYEAVAVEKPLITSDTRALRAHFRKGTLYSRHDSESLAAAMRSAAAHKARLVDEMKSLKVELAAEWEEQRAALQELVATHSGLAASAAAGIRAKAVLRDSAAIVSRAVTARTPRVLMYHRFGPEGSFRRLPVDRFEAHLQYLARHFRVRPLSEISAAIRDGVAVEPRTIALTVDDGYADFLEYAYPLLERYELQATLFVTTGFLDRSTWLWFDAIHYLCHAATASRPQILLPSRTLQLDLDGVESRNRAWEALADECQPLTPAARSAVLRDLQNVLQVALPAEPTGDYAAITWDGARRTDPRLVEFGSHTVTHPALSRCTPEEIEWEVRESKRVIEARLQRKVEGFCYPHGQPGDYDERSIQLVRSAGYACATVAHAGLIRPGSDVYQLPRVSAATSDMSQFRSAVNGLRDLRNAWRPW